MCVFRQLLFPLCSRTTTQGPLLNLSRWCPRTFFKVRHLPHGVDNASLKQAFEGAGLTVKNARVLAFPRRDGRFISRGYGWVALEHESEMKKGMRLDGMKINDVRISPLITSQVWGLLAFCPDTPLCFLDGRSLSGSNR